MVPLTTTRCETALERADRTRASRRWLARNRDLARGIGHPNGCRRSRRGRSRGCSTPTQAAGSQDIRTQVCVPGVYRRPRTPAPSSSLESPKTPATRAHQGTGEHPSTVLQPAIRVRVRPPASSESPAKTRFLGDRLHASETRRNRFVDRFCTATRRETGPTRRRREFAAPSRGGLHAATASAPASARAAAISATGPIGGKSSCSSMTCPQVSSLSEELGRAACRALSFRGDRAESGRPRACRPTHAPTPATPYHPRLPAERRAG